MNSKRKLSLAVSAIVRTFSFFALGLVAPDSSVAQVNFPEFQSQWLRAPSILEKYRLEKELLDKDGIEGFREVAKKSEGTLAVVCRWAILKAELNSLNPTEVHTVRSRCRDFLKLISNETGLKPPVQWQTYLTSVRIGRNGEFFADIFKLDKLRDQCELISLEPFSIKIDDICFETLTANDFETNGYIKRLNGDGSLRWIAPIWATYTFEEGINYGQTGVPSSPIWISYAIDKEDLVVWGLDSNGAWFMRLMLESGIQKDAFLITW